GTIIKWIKKNWPARQQQILLHPCFAFLEDFDDIGRNFGVKQFLPKLIIAKNPHQSADKTKVLRVHGSWNADKHHELKRTLLFLERVSQPSKCHQHLCHRRSADRRQGEAVPKVHFTDRLMVAQSSQKLLPIGNPCIGTKGIGELFNSVFPGISGNIQKNMLGEERFPDSNHMALPLQRSLAPRISAKVRFFGKRSGSLSSAGRTVTASLGCSCINSCPSTLAKSCCSP